MDIVYAMPEQRHRLFVNVIHSCPNACFFCIDFKGSTFYGFDLKRGRSATADEIVSAIEKFPYRCDIKEIYFCGIGEPLLLYDRVVESAVRIRPKFKPNVVLAINTSGTFYLKHQRVDFASKFDLIQISLNAECEEKYNLICRPKVQGAYQALMNFLVALHEFLARTEARCRVELSVVDTSGLLDLPEASRLRQDVPIPDIEACSRIAAGFGWPLKVKKPMEGWDNSEWDGFAGRIRDATSEQRRAP